MAGPAGRNAFARAALLAPALLLVAAVVLVPFGMAVIDSFQSFGEWTVANYADVLLRPPYATILRNTATVAAITTAVSMALALPAASFLARQGGRAAAVVLGLLAATLWISILVKVYAWQIVLARSGPLNALLLAAGITARPLDMLYTRGAVILAMVQAMVPSACILLCAGMRRVDWEIITAARTLGARMPQIFLEVYWPQVRYTVVLTTLVVFIGASSFFVAPALLGGPGEMMIGSKMQSDLVNQYESGLAATGGVLLTLLLLAATAVAVVLAGRSYHHPAGGRTG